MNKEMKQQNMHYEDLSLFKSDSFVNIFIETEIALVQYLFLEIVFTFISEW